MIRKMINIDSTNGENMGNQESAENYLETIFILKNKNGVVRSIDIVHELGITKPSVSVAMKNLKQKGLITVEEKGYIELTEEGYNIADMVYERHVVISKMLEKLGVSPDIAVKDACKIEHVISSESFQAIKEHVKKYI